MLLVIVHVGLATLRDVTKLPSCYFSQQATYGNDVHYEYNVYVCTYRRGLASHCPFGMSEAYNVSEQTCVFQPIRLGYFSKKFIGAIIARGRILFLSMIHRQQHEKNSRRGHDLWYKICFMYIMTVKRI